MSDRITNTTQADGTEERLKTVAVGSSASAYAYNGLGQRVAKTENAVSNTYTFETDAIDAPVLSDGAATYVHGQGLLSETRNNIAAFYHPDALGSTREMTSSAQAITDKFETDAFGNTVAASGSNPTPWGFAGQYGYQTDAATGLMILGYRYYDASAGRFISRDPIWSGTNWYIYADNDPVNEVDPDGLDPIEKDGSFKIKFSLSATVKAVFEFDYHIQINPIGIDVKPKGAGIEITKPIIGDIRGIGRLFYGNDTGFGGSVTIGGQL